MRAVAIIAGRNAEVHISRCLQQWISDECSVVFIDHDSDDRTVDIAKSYLGRGLLSIERSPWTGVFSLRDQLLRKDEIARQLDTDWIIHADADEWHCSPWNGMTMLEAIERVDAEGFNCIQFDEMTFVPWPDEDFYHPNYHREMLWYYAFEPFTPHLMRAWRRTIEPNNVGSGGHMLTASVPLSPHPTHFTLRHYIVLSFNHACRKYIGRPYDPQELAIGWHGDRAQRKPDEFRLRPSRHLRKLPRWDSQEFDRSSVVRKFFWEWGPEDQ